VEEEDPALSVGLGLRTGLALDPKGAPDDKASLAVHDGIVDQVTVRPYFSGQVNDYIGFEGNLEGTTGGVVVLDAVAKFSLDPLFNVWVGQFLPPSSRSNLSGPYYLNSWNFPLFVAAFPFDYAGRDRGFAIQGDIAGGVFKYQVGLFDLEPTNPIGASRMAGRLVLNLLDPEPGYYNSSTYYGDKDIFAIGITGQYQNPESATDDDKLKGFQADILFEKNLQESGVLTLEGSIWIMGSDPAYVGIDANGDGDFSDMNDVAPANTFVAVNPTGKGTSFFVLASWLTPDKVGIGHIQPNVRLEYSKPDGADAGFKLDGGLAYIIDGHNTRLALLYSHTKAAGTGDSSDAVQFGTQIQLW
jgi:hypothetical protein